jgi:CRISPR-associated protein Csd1
MILQALKEYYDRKAADPESGIAPIGWEWKEIHFIIVLDKKGSFLQFEDTREGEGIRKRGKSFLVPQGVKKTSGIAANLLWDNARYIGYCEYRRA